MFCREIGLLWVFPQDFFSLLMSWRMFGVPRKGKILWNLLLPAICWSIWLERNQTMFEGCAEPVLNVVKKAKDLACFWGVNCNLGEDYLVVSTKRDWCSMFL